MMKATKMMKAIKTSMCMTAAAACVLGGVAGMGGVALASAGASRPLMTQAVKQYLNEHGDLCVGKSTWPRFVTEEDRRAGTNDALQMPVLERLGLVESADVLIPLSQATGTEAAAGSAPAKRYSLTRKGREFYLQKKLTVLGAHDRPVERAADFCVARLSLDKVVKWSSPEEAHGHVETVVSYTYKVKSADWMVDPEARRVFPVVDRIIHGEGNALMTATLQVQNGKWVPVLPGQ
jgi:hypothetical protein